MSYRFRMENSLEPGFLSLSLLSSCGKEGSQCWGSREQASFGVSFPCHQTAYILFSELCGTSINVFLFCLSPGLLEEHLPVLGDKLTTFPPRTPLFLGHQFGLRIRVKKAG